VTRATIAGGMARTGTDRWDVLIVGAGPSGAAAAYWLAEAGHRVLVVERKRFPRDKTCGDGLTPRAVRQLEDMGLGSRLTGHLRFDGLRSYAHGITLELNWPEHPDFPSYGYVVRRRDLDAMVAQPRAAGIEVDVDPEPYPNGRFAGLHDPEGNAVQLWEDSDRR